jgi:hypothetical protein
MAPHASKHQPCDEHANERAPHAQCNTRMLAKAMTRIKHVADALLVS